MRAVVQRVTRASVLVDGVVVGRCGLGFVLLVGVRRDDTAEAAAKLAGKIAGLRILNDADGKMNLCLGDVEASEEPNVLAISNFTVYGDARKSRRPSFTDSAPFDEARALFSAFVDELRTRGLRVETGRFGEHMEVSLSNNGPVTLIVDS
ncbi:MAG: D-aminoacyl-tRNA deacylase [Fimbriimonadaceae bacterium]